MDRGRVGSVYGRRTDALEMRWSLGKLGPEAFSNCKWIGGLSRNRPEQLPRRRKLGATGIICMAGMGNEA
jgi:hypothetical protein